MAQDKLGRWAFVIGLIISILLGFVTFSYAILLLVILGLIVGFLNVTEKESNKFLVAVIALIVVGVASLQALSVLGTFYTWMETVLTSFVVFVAAAAVVVSIKVLFETSRES